MSGIFGAYSSTDKDVVNSSFMGVSFLQHRGEIGAGMVIGKDGRIGEPYKKLGNRVYIVLQDVLDQFKLAEPNVAVAHTKFGRKDQLEPNVYEGERYRTAFSKDGNIIGMLTYDIGRYLHNCLEKTHDIYEAAKEFMTGLYGRGAYSIVWAVADKKTGDMYLVGIRDPFGINPFCKGRKNGTFLLSSETVGIRSCGGTCTDFVEPGGVVVFYGDKELPTEVVLKAPRHYHDFFEYLYFASHVSWLDGANRSNFEIRYDIGRDLAYMYPLYADLYAGSPDSGLSVMRGYIRGMNEQVLDRLQNDGKRITMDDLIEDKMIIIKNRGAVRTFMADTSVREMESSLKFIFNESMINPNIKVIDPERNREEVVKTVGGRKVVILDDSLVKGTVKDSTFAKIEACGGRIEGFVLSSPALVAKSIRDFDDKKQRLLHGHWDETNEEKMRIATELLGYPVYYPDIPDVVKQIGTEDLDLSTVSGWFPLTKEFLPEGYRSLL